MLSASSTVRELIKDGVPQVQWIADLMYDRQRRLANVPIGRPDLTWDASQFVAGSGQVQIVWADDFGRSMIPRVLGDWFSPFGAELQIDVLLGAGVFSERVPVGRFMIDEVVDARNRPIRFDGRDISIGETFGLNLKDPMVRVQRDRFPFPTAPTSTSAWQEIQSVSGMPVIRNLPDVTLPGGTTYEGEKAAQLSKLFDVLGAWPMLTSSGALTARSKTWGDAVDALEGLVDAPVSMDSARTYNRAVVEGKAADNSPLYGVADVSEGFLRTANGDGTSSPFGVAVVGASSNYLTTQDQVDAAARDLLRRTSKIRGVTRTLVEPLNPLRELGDVVELDGGGVRISRIHHTASTTELTVEVPDGP